MRLAVETLPLCILREPHPECNPALLSDDLSKQKKQEVLGEHLLEMAA